MCHWLKRASYKQYFKLKLQCFDEKVHFEQDGEGGHEDNGKSKQAGSQADRTDLISIRGARATEGRKVVRHGGEEDEKDADGRSRVRKTGQDRRARARYAQISRLNS